MNDDINLRPYFRAVWQWRWWVIILAIVGAVCGYLLYRSTPAEYQLRGTLTFRGDTVVTNSANQIVTTQLVNAIEATALLDDYERHIAQARQSSLAYQNIKELSYEINRNNIYPITVTFTLREPTLESEISNDLIQVLNSSALVKTIINQQHSALDTKISLLDAQIKEARVSADQKVQWQIEKTDLQLNRQSIEGFRYVGIPYLVNDGDPVAPDREMYVLAGFIAGAVLVKLLAVMMVVLKQFKHPTSLRHSKIKD